MLKKTRFLRIHIYISNLRKNHHISHYKKYYDPDKQTGGEGVRLSGLPATATDYVP